jgi:hypothetical protein
MRKFLGVITGVVIFTPVYYVAQLIIALLGAPILMLFGIHVAQSPEALANLEAASQIIAVILAIIAAGKIYQRIAGVKATTSLPSEESKIEHV